MVVPIVILVYQRVGRIQNLQDELNMVKIKVGVPGSNPSGGLSQGALAIAVEFEP